METLEHEIRRLRIEINVLYATKSHSTWQELRVIETLIRAKRERIEQIKMLHVGGPMR